MPIKTQCQCGAKFAAPDKLAGKKVKCPKCSEPVRVAAAGGAENAISVSCACGKSLNVPPKFAGKAIKCPACAKPLSVPDPNAAGLDMGLAGLLDEVDLNQSRTGRRCENCRGDLGPSDVICVKCGFNTETGKQLKTKKLKKVELDPAKAAIQGASAGKPVEAPAPVQTLAKLLNQVGMLAVLAAFGYVAYKCYESLSQSNNDFTADQVITVMTGTPGYVLGAAVLLLAVPCSVAASLVQEGKPAGRFLSMAMGFVGLLGLITTLPAILVLKLAFSDDVARYCE